MAQNGLTTALAFRQNNKCHFCNLEMTELKDEMLPSTMTLEHCLARARGGINGLCNLSASCNQCNGLRGSMDERLFLLIVKKLFMDDDIREHWHSTNSLVRKLIRKIVKLEVMYAYAFISAHHAHAYLEASQKYR